MVDGKMKRIGLMKNGKGQVLGLPMYLIIIMIVAVAVIAAVIFMIPKGTQTKNAQVTSGSLISITGDGKITSAGVAVMISVTTNDERADPVSGATVTLTGAGVASQGTTAADGTYTFPAAEVKPILEANINEAHLKLTVKAPGFEDFEDDTAVTVVRTQA